ncbi:MAG: alpha/beta hydrolase [Desulfobacterales bacterium]|jgi:pimeloyl-ACP methyl ester carboxylesterase|nr:alpha/beta hydrolase [Desulfobacterales bacterium]
MKTPQALSAFFRDTELQYLLYDGDGPAIVLVHATGFNPWQWHPIARELSESYRIIAPFFCDHRSTDPNKGGLRWPVLANDLVSLCRQLEIENPFMVGHSMGGSVCVLAHEILPDMAQKMILIEPILLSDDYYKGEVTLDRLPLAEKAMKRRNKWKNHEEVETYLRSKSLFSDWDDEMLKIYLDYGISEATNGELELTCSPFGEAALFMGSFARDPEPVLPHINCPVLVVEGGKSDSRARLNLPKVVKLLPKGEHRIIADAGHLIPMEKPKLILEMIQSYFL